MIRKENSDGNGLYFQEEKWRWISHGLEVDHIGRSHIGFLKSDSTNQGCLEGWDISNRETTQGKIVSGQRDETGPCQGNYRKRISQQKHSMRTKICIWNTPCQWCSSKGLTTRSPGKESRFVAFLISTVRFLGSCCSQLRATNVTSLNMEKMHNRTPL